MVIRLLVLSLFSGIGFSGCSSDSVGGGSSGGGGGLPVVNTTISLTLQVNDPGWYVDLEFAGGLKDFNWGDGLCVGGEYLFTGVSGLSHLSSLTSFSMNANSIGVFDTSDLPSSLTTLILPDNGITTFAASVLPASITKLDLRINPALPSTVATEVFARLVLSNKTNGTLSLPSFTFTAGSQTCLDRATLRNNRGWNTSGISGC